jgi:hypothetical protein
MRSAARPRTEDRLIEWGVASRALEGEPQSGDQHLVRPFPGGVLLAAVDGLGHGDEAALAARRATSTLGSHAHEPVGTLVQRCHAALAGTRGVVMSLASFVEAEARVTWLGVGNVEGVLVRASPAAAPPQHVLLLRGGIVGGHRLPTLYTSVVPVAPGDTLAFATDGIRRDFAAHVTPSLAPQAIADRILAREQKGGDDALVLVARFLAEEP